MLGVLLDRLNLLVALGLRAQRMMFLIVVALLRQFGPLSSPAACSLPIPVRIRSLRVMLDSDSSRLITLLSVLTRALGFPAAMEDREHARHKKQGRYSGK